MKRTCIGFLTVVVSSFAWGVGLPDLQSNTVGNGGDVLNCSYNGSVSMLDLYEGGSRYQFIYEPAVAATPHEHLFQQLERWRRIDPYLVDYLKAQVAEFDGEAIYLDGVTLEDINDSGYIAVPDGCTVEQIAIQRPPMFPRDPWFTIDNDLWQQMDVLNQAALILHEIIYRQAVAQLKLNSISSRYLTALLLSTEYVDFSVTDYLEVLYATRHLFAERVTLDDHELWIHDAAAFHRGEAEMTGHPAGPLTVTADSGHEVILPTAAIVGIDVSNQVTAAYFDPPEFIDVWGEELEVDSLRFDPVQGFLVEAHLAENELFSRSLTDRCGIEVGGDGYLQFNSDGELERAVAPAPGVQVCIAGSVYANGSGSVVSIKTTRVLDGWFHPNGLLRRAFFEEKEVVSLHRRGVSFVGILVDFHDNGAPKYIAVHGNHSSFEGRNPDGTVVFCSRHIRLDPQGYVESCRR